MKKESHSHNTIQNQEDDVSANPIGFDEISNIPDNENYLSDLKSFLSKHWANVKEKLNEDVKLKVEYTGVGVEPFIKIGKKIKHKFIPENQVMILGQDSQEFPWLIEKESNIKSIQLNGICFDNNLDFYSYKKKNNNNLNLIGSKSGHSLKNITRKNTTHIKAFVIYISLGSNDPLEEFYEYMKMIEKFKLLNVYILVTFINEVINQHNSEGMIDAINMDYENQVDIINIHAKKLDMNTVFKQVRDKISNNDKDLEDILKMCDSISSDA